MSAVASINEDLLDVARRMRAADRAEVFAVMPHLSTLEWVEWISRAPGSIEVATHAGERVAVCGAVLLAPHLATTWMIGTDGLRRAGAKVATHRAALRLHRALDAMGVTRCQAMPWAGNAVARQWLTSLDYDYEGTHYGMGTGELQDFVSYARTHDGRN